MHFFLLVKWGGLKVVRSNRGWRQARLFFFKLVKNTKLVTGVGYIHAAVVRVVTNRKKNYPTGGWWPEAKTRKIQTTLLRSSESRRKFLGIQKNDVIVY